MSEDSASLRRQLAHADLIQLIGHTLVTRFNQQTYEEGREHERRFHLADVEAVINAPEFDRDGDAYFSGVWWQAEQSSPAGQPEVLRALCRSDTSIAAPRANAGELAGRPGMTVAELAAPVGMTPDQLQATLATLINHDIVTRDGDRYRYTVELMRRWVARRKGDMR